MSPLAKRRGAIGKTAFQPEFLADAYRLAAHEATPKAAMLGAAVWLAIAVVIGQERIAAAHLIARRFAIYLPEMEVNDRGRKCLEFMFPGHLFVFVWGVDQHWTRIKACPGVLEILGSIPDDQLRRVQKVENERYPLVSSIKIGKKKRWRRTRREEIIDYDNEIISIRPWSAFTDGLRGIDSAGRNNLLRRALGV